MCNLNDDPDRQVLKEWGERYIKLPHYILEHMFISPTAQSKLGKLYFILYCYCYHHDGFVKLDGRHVSCRRGEFVGKQEQLSRILGIGICSVRRMLQQLQSRGLIGIEKIKGESRIRINGYYAFNPLPATPVKDNQSQLTPQESMRIYEEGLRQGRVLTAAQIQRIYEEEKSRND